MFLSCHDDRRLYRIVTCVLVAVMGMIAARTAAAQTVRLEADASVFMSDNPFLIPGENKLTGAAEFVVRPEVVWPLGPSTTLNANGAIGYRQYHRRYGNFLTGRMNASLHHRRNEYLSVDGSVSYARELPPDALTDSIDAAIDSLSIRESYTARGSLTWNPNARLSVVGEAGWQKTRYPRSTLLATTNIRDVAVEVSKRVSPLMTVGVRGDLTESDSAFGADTSTRTLRLTAARRLAAAWRANIEAGLEWARPNRGPGQARGVGAQFSGSARLCYEPPHTVACISATIRSEATGLGELGREKTFDLTVTRRLSEHGTLTASAEYRSARFTLLDARSDVLRCSTAYDHRLSNRFSVGGRVDYLRRTRPTGERIDATIFWIGVTFRGLGE